MEYRIVVVGLSAGGLNALCTVLRGLPESFAMPMVIIQHRSKDSTSLCDVLQGCTSLPLHEAVDKSPILPGQLFIAPPDYHLLVDDGFLSLSLDEPVLFSRPSIDVAFESAANSFGSRVVGVVMTGANRDGSAGLRRIVDLGGYAVVQDPAGAEARTMPAAAMRAVPEATVLALDDIAAHLARLGATDRKAGRGARS